MKEAKFKAGDKVYCPTLGNDIYTLKNAHADPNSPNNFILTTSKGGLFENSGRMFADRLPRLFHANKKNHTLLEKLYGVAFEAPPTPKNPKEIIQAMLDDGWDSVPCILLATPEKLRKHLLVGVRDASKVDRGDIIPFDPKTGKIIIDYVDGEIVTE